MVLLVWVTAVGPAVEGAEGVTELKSTDWIKGDGCWRCSGCASARLFARWPSAGLFVGDWVVMVSAKPPEVVVLVGN